MHVSDTTGTKATTTALQKNTRINKEPSSPRTAKRPPLQPHISRREKSLHSYTQQRLQPWSLLVYLRHSRLD